jgi:hypothetical protein
MHCPLVGPPVVSQVGWVATVHCALDEQATQAPLPLHTGWPGARAAQSLSKVLLAVQARQAPLTSQMGAVPAGQLVRPPAGEQAAQAPLAAQMGVVPPFLVAHCASKLPLPAVQPMQEPWFASLVRSQTDCVGDKVHCVEALHGPQPLPGPRQMGVLALMLWHWASMTLLPVQLLQLPSLLQMGVPEGQLSGVAVQASQAPLPLLQIGVVPLHTKGLVKSSAQLTQAPPLSQKGVSTLSVRHCVLLLHRSQVPPLQMGRVASQVSPAPHGSQSLMTRSHTCVALLHCKFWKQKPLLSGESCVPAAPSPAPCVLPPPS